ncbi:hypothetical protein ASPACDRAFT_76359 [Aspergillus aculeatus ATCC 16872]|uniref:Inhibitor I9 domain-containing protein n=1 Tax=Aspergillus aculeatus (strain ATCC 16872 / CBS 172.66 / WB 5094) TaxID=690307 RepID=A0A1L9X4U3_ASPA1|nr:uncharacterized protein ASPACDRAFT_76359 [Aspergillus aculeatus ATCC 16872]OJK03298.1 hypothetical protein ASPACDRAFT_76359 [Aspergillus aculeatus ATCC 16872]
MQLISAAISSLVPLTLAKSVLVSFPAGTPDSVLQQAKDSVLNAGGQITHEFTLIKGFSADCPEEAIQQISTQSAAYKPTIEQDQMVSIQ